MTDLESRVVDLERRLLAVESGHGLKRLGPGRDRAREIEEQGMAAIEGLVAAVEEKTRPVGRENHQLASGAPVPSDGSHAELEADGQQVDYVVLSPEERAKGFVRPVRRSYKHAGGTGPRHPLRDMDDAEKERYSACGYVKFEAYPEGDSCVTGRYWTRPQLEAVGRGCGTVTTMGRALAETYARDPGFYSATFCCGCGEHLPVSEFVWDGTDERVGS